MILHGSPHYSGRRENVCAGRREAAHPLRIGPYFDDVILYCSGRMASPLIRIPDFSREDKIEWRFIPLRPFCWKGWILLLCPHWTNSFVSPFISTMSYNRSENLDIMAGQVYNFPRAGDDPSPTVEIWYLWLSVDTKYAFWSCHCSSNENWNASG